MNKFSEEIYPFGSQHPRISNPMSVARVLASREKYRELTPKEKALKKSAEIQLKLFRKGLEMKPLKTEDKIYSMAFVKECKNLSKEDKLTILEFIYNEKDIKKVLEVVEKYVELEEGIWTRVVETIEELKELVKNRKTKRPESLSYTKPEKKMLKFAGKPPKSMNKQLSTVISGKNEPRKIEWKKLERKQ